MNQLPTQLYYPEDVKRLDELAIKSGIPGYTLMRRAGQAAFNVVLERFPDAKQLLVLCGAGNNAGDGYVVARLAQQHGLNVTVFSLVEAEMLQADARQACLHWLECGVITADMAESLQTADVVIDALLGTGLTRDVEGSWKACIDEVNASSRPVVSIDVPSGLDAKTGAIKACAMKADITVSFIGLKTGLFTASGKACCGEVLFDSLAIPQILYDQVKPVAELLSSPSCQQLPERRHDSHKGVYGHVVIIGGNQGMPGAVILAARAALRSGAGRVSVVTREQHICAVAAVCPESMVHASINGELPEGLIETASSIAIGPGLGRDAWAFRLLHQVLLKKQHMVLDADALNIIAEKQLSIQANHVVTPHPGEAARLLSLSTAEVQNDRYQAIHALQKKLAGAVVLKGSGTMIFDGEHLQLCPYGGPQMATAGMGDVLTGVITALLAQGLSPNEAASRGVCLHAIAADNVAGKLTRGVLATDVIEQLPKIML